jgi:hypothetical protein
MARHAAVVDSLHSAALEPELWPHATVTMVDNSNDAFLADEDRPD